MTSSAREALYTLAESWRTSIPIPCDADLITQAGIEGQEEQAWICAQALIDKIAELQACETHQQPDLDHCCRCGVLLPIGRDWIGSQGSTPMCQQGNGECDRRAAEKGQ